MRQRQTLAYKLVRTGIVFLAVALGAIGLTLWVSWQLEGGAAAVNEAGRMRMLMYRIAADAAAGRAAEVAEQAARMEGTLELLRVGDPSRPLFIPGGASGRAELAALRARWDAWRPGWRVDTGTPRIALADADTWVRQVESFVSSIERRLSFWTTLLRATQLTMVALAILGAMLLLYASHLMVLEPLRRLDEGLGAIRNGDFAARVAVTSTDEFGDLAAGFNAMAERLQTLYETLEAKVTEKTAHLEIERSRLASLYDVSAFVARAEHLDALAQGFVARIRRIARADAVALRWTDEPGQRSLMLAHEGLPTTFANEEQCIAHGDCHCGPAVAGSTPTRVIPIGAAGSALGHCGRAGFGTLVSVPVASHQRALGEIDLFYRDADPLDEEEHVLLEALASHLAGGMESLRAAAAEKEAAIAGERTLLAQELHDSIAQSLAFLKIQVTLLKTALTRADAPGAERTLAEIDAGVRECYSDVRELLLHFRTRTVAGDIGQALRTTLQKFEHQSGVPAELRIDGHGVPLPADLQVQILHMVQEALSNVRKHAGASKVRVHVVEAPQWRFEIVDDGRGFDPAADAGANHVGLRIMRERAERAGIDVEVESRPGHGTRVIVTVPRAAPEEESTHELADPIAGR